MHTGLSFLHNLSTASSEDTGLWLSRYMGETWHLCNQMEFLVVTGQESLEWYLLPGKEVKFNVPRS